MAGWNKVGKTFYPPGGGPSSYHGATGYGKGSGKFGGVSVVVTGIKDIDRKLKFLPGRIQKKVLRQAMREGLKVMAAEVKAQVPVDTGLTKKNVRVRAVKKKRRDEIQLEVRVGGDEELYKTSAKTGTTVFYPALVEYGRKNVPPNPFMRRAFEAKGEIARQVTIDEIRAGVESEASKI
jgi:HK97 gp10 family phage protein